MSDLKTTIRRRMRERAKQMTAPQRAVDSARACCWLTGMTEFERAHVVATYLATGSEVDTADIIKAALEQEKRVCVPAWRDGLASYGFCWLTPDTALREGRLRISEPLAPLWVDEGVDLMVVPGLAFDAAGGRLGHGGGFYDRLTTQPEARSAARVGLAFGWQIVASVPMLAHDVRMDAVFTEKGAL